MYSNSWLKENFVRVSRRIIGHLPGVRQVTRCVRLRRFSGTTTYWEQRYAKGGNSGSGSYGNLAAFKAQVLNALIVKHRVQSVLELGCGDGAQLELAQYPSYVGLEVSPTGLRMCISRFAEDISKSFFLYDPTCFVDSQGLFKADLTLSLDVIYHLIEDEMFETHLRHLFSCSKRLVVIYSSDENEVRSAEHVKHRLFSSWVRRELPEWEMLEQLSNPFSGADGPTLSLANFTVYRYIESPADAVQR